MSKPLRAAILVAVSTPRQAAADRTSLDRQLADCRGEIERRGGAWLPAGEFVIPGRSRNIRYLAEAEAAIPELAAFLARVRAGDLDLVIVPDFDRMARTRALSVQVSEYLREYHVQTYSLAQPVQPVSAAHYDPAEADTAIIVEAIAGVKSQLDNSARRRRVTKGREEQARRGVHLNVPPYGYKLMPRMVEEGGRAMLTLQRVVHPEEGPTWRIIWRLASFHRYSDRRITRVLNGVLAHPEGLQGPWPSRKGLPWQDTTIGCILTNPIYGGRLRYNRVRRKGGRKLLRPLDQVLWADAPELAFVSGEEWEAYQELRRQRAVLGGRAVSSPRNPLAGLLVCGVCGHRMWMSGKREVINCGKNWSTGLCESNRIGVHKLLRLVDAELLALAAEAPGEDSAPAVAGEPVELQGLRADLARAERELARVPHRRQMQYRDREDGVLTVREYVELRDSLRIEEARLQQQIAALRNDIEQWTNRQRRSRERLAQLATLAEDLASDDVERRRAVYMALIDRVVITHGTVSVHLR